MSFGEWLGEGTAAALIAGAAGGIVRTLTLRQSSWRDVLVNIAVGSLCALYLGPIAEPMLDPVLGPLAVKEGGVAGVSGFVIGLGGITLSGLFLDVWHRRRRDLKGEGCDDA